MSTPSDAHLYHPLKTSMKPMENPCCCLLKYPWNRLLVRVLIDKVKIQWTLQLIHTAWYILNGWIITEIQGITSFLPIFWLAFFKWIKLTHTAKNNIWKKSAAFAGFYFASFPWAIAGTGELSAHCLLCVCGCVCVCVWVCVCVYFPWAIAGSGELSAHGLLCAESVRATTECSNHFSAMCGKWNNWEVKSYVQDNGHF